MGIQDHLDEIIRYLFQPEVLISITTLHIQRFKSLERKQLCHPLRFYLSQGSIFVRKITSSYQNKKNQGVFLCYSEYDFSFNT